MLVLNFSMVGNMDPPTTPLICREYQWKCDPVYCFVGGTIFWIRYETLVNQIQSHRVDLIREYSLMKPGKEQAPSRMHAWERIFGVMVYENGQYIAESPFDIYQDLLLASLPTPDEEETLRQGRLTSNKPRAPYRLRYRDKDGDHENVRRVS